MRPLARPPPISWPFRAAASLAALASALSLIGWLSARDLLRAGEEQRVAGLVLCAVALGISHLRSRVLSRAVGRALALSGQALLLLGVVDVAPHVVRSLAVAGLCLGLAFAFCSGDRFERVVGAAGVTLAICALGAELWRGLLPFAIGLALVGAAAIARAVQRGSPRAWASGMAWGALLALFFWPSACVGISGLCLAAAVLATFGLPALPLAIAAALITQLGPGPWLVGGLFALAIGEEREVRELSVLGAISVVAAVAGFEHALPGPALLHFAVLAVLGIATLRGQARIRQRPGWPAAAPAMNLE